MRMELLLSYNHGHHFMKKVMLIMLDMFILNSEHMLSLFRDVFTEEIVFFTFLHLVGLDMFSRVR